MEREAQQLPKEYPGIICINTSGVSCGYEKWIPLIQRRFQSNINTRISAVFLFSKAMNSEKIIGSYLDNPFAKYNINKSLKSVFEKIIKN